MLLCVRDTYPDIAHTKSPSCLMRQLHTEYSNFNTQLTDEKQDIATEPTYTWAKGA